MTIVVKKVPKFLRGIVGGNKYDYSCKKSSKIPKRNCKIYLWNQG